MLSRQIWRALALASILGVAIYVLYTYVTTAAWLPAILIGLWFPAFGIHQWMRLRACEPVDAADRVLSVILAAQIGYLVAAEMYVEQAHSDQAERLRENP